MTTNTQPTAAPNDQQVQQSPILVKIGLDLDDWDQSAATKNLDSLRRSTERLAQRLASDAASHSK